MSSVEVDAGSLAEVATAAWRLRNRVDDGPIARHVRAVLDALTGAGVEMRRYEGAAFDSGLKIRVLAFQPTPGLDREEITETVRPAVFLRGAPIQLGEVIVGVPVTEPTAANEGAHR